MAKAIEIGYSRGVSWSMQWHNLRLSGGSRTSTKWLNAPQVPSEKDGMRDRREDYQWSSRVRRGGDQRITGQKWSVVERWLCSADEGLAAEATLRS